MLVYLRTDLFSSPAQTLVNAVNVEGVMGKGIAKTFKERYPEMFREYRLRCQAGELQIGKLMLWRGPDKWVLNFPTKTTWRQPSRLEYVEQGLKRFAEVYDKLGITSISFPPLGCGNGNLEWEVVKPLMELHLKKVQVPVYIHDRQVPPDFVPEHLETEPAQRPSSLTQFLEDVRGTAERRQAFRTLSGSGYFEAKPTSLGGLRIVTEARSESIPEEELASAWSALQSGLLTPDLYSDHRSRRYKSYLFAVLATLPYVLQAEVQHVHGKHTAPSYALLLRPSTGQAAHAETAGDQLALWG